MTHDPQNDWSEDGTCVKCGGYAVIAGNGSPRRHGVTISCEGDCGDYYAEMDADGDLFTPAPAVAVVLPETFDATDAF